MTRFNIYFGTVGKKLSCKYQFTKVCKNEQEALKLAENSAQSLYYKYEGRYGLPSYNQIIKESEITGVDIEILYQDHIKDMTRFYVIPTELDSIPYRKLKY